MSPVFRRPLFGGWALLLVLLSTQTGAAQTCGESAAECALRSAPGPIAHWTLDGDGSDQSGGERPLEVVGAGFASGVSGNALDLHNDGRQFAQRPVHDPELDLGAGDFTVQAWVNFNTTLREQTLVETFSGSTGPGWTLTKLATSQLEFFAPPAVDLRSPVQDIQPSVWHHIIVRRRGTDFDMVFNGTPVAYGSSAQAISISGMPLLVGRRNALDWRNFAVDGRIDEIAIWPRALSDAEITFLFNNGGSGNASPPVGSPNRPPVADAGPDQALAATRACQATADLDGRRSQDPDADTLTYTWSGPFGTVSGPTAAATLPLGRQTITLVVDDGKGGAASDQLVVDVSDVTPPAISALTVAPGVLWPPDHRMVPVTVGVTAADSCTAVSCRIVSVTSNEPVNGLGDGDRTPDWVITGPLAASLRAERRARGDGRTYTLTVRCTDGSGNASTKSVTVTVPADRDHDGERLTVGTSSPRDGRPGITVRGVR